MHRVCMALALVAALPFGARAEPVSVLQSSSSSGATLSGGSSSGLSLDLGDLTLTGADPVATILVSDLRVGSDYAAFLDISSTWGIEEVRVEILDPLDHDDAFDPSQPGYVPEGYTTSNDIDGYSFAQRSGLDRSATFAGGTVAGVADEMTHRGDILLFSGLAGAEEARVAFGLRNWSDTGFLLRITALLSNAPSDAVPEPGSLILLGSGLAGIAGLYRRRKLSGTV